MDWLELSHPLVLQNIFRYLDTSDLTNSRLVNKSWNYEANQVLKKRETIHFTSCQELKNYCETFKNSSYSNLTLSFHSYVFEGQLFTDALKNHVLGGKPLDLHETLQTFIIVSGKNVFRLATDIMPVFTFPEMTPIDLSASFMLEFLLKMIYEGFPNLRSLHINLLIERSHVPENFDATTTIDSFLSKKKELPNLKEVTLKLHNIVPGGAYEVIISSFIKTLLASAKNLQRLSSWSRWDSGDVNLLLKDRIMTNITSVSSTLRLITIKEQLSNFDLDRLTSHHLPNLECVDFSIDVLTTTEDCLKRFLLKVQNFIRILNLCFITAGGRKCLKFSSQLPPAGVTLKGLEALHVNHYCDGVIALQNIPKLQKLVLRNCENVTISNTSLLPIIQPSRLDLSSSSMLEGFSYEYLTSLKIEGVQCPSLSTIYNRAKLLRNLSVKFCKGVNDEIICGMRVPILKTISFIGTLQKDSCKEEVDKVISMANLAIRGKPYIGNLQELRSVTLKGDFTDASIIFGVVQCRKLERLQMACFTQDFTWKAALILKHGLQNLVEMSLW